VRPVLATEDESANGVTPVGLELSRSVTNAIISGDDKQASLTHLGQPSHVLGVSREQLAQMDGTLAEGFHPSHEL